MGVKVWDIDGYKLWYLGVFKSKNVVGIIVDKDLQDEVKQVNDRITVIKLVIGGILIKVVSVYVL